VDVDRNFRGAYRLYHQGESSFIALMLDAVRISEKSVYFHETTRLYTPTKLSSSYSPP
jgi:hypothetical protein